MQSLPFDLGSVIASVTTIITDSGRAEGVGDARGRGCAGVRRRAPRERPVLRQRRPELHPARDRLRRLPGPSRQPLLPGSNEQRECQRHNERCADKLSLGRAEQRGDIQRRDERPHAKSTHEIRRRSLPFVGRQPFAASDAVAAAAALAVDASDVRHSADSPVSLRKDELMRSFLPRPRGRAAPPLCDVGGT